MSSSVARKISPFDICQPKVKLDVENLVYNHETQSVLADSNVIHMSTWNGTQTFDSKGRPNDKDHDK